MRSQARTLQPAVGGEPGPGNAIEVMETPPPRAGKGPPFASTRDPSAEQRPGGAPSTCST